MNNIPWPVEIKKIVFLSIKSFNFNSSGNEKVLLSRCVLYMFHRAECPDDPEVMEYGKSVENTRSGFLQ
jgi:hypothetical protein